MPSIKLSLLAKLNGSKLWKWNSSTTTHARGSFR